ncbi:hypothetical protein N9C96_00765 [bacterium]|nr:hypothetical protein [bacterium]
MQSYGETKRDFSEPSFTRENPAHTSSDWDSILDGHAMKPRFRSLSDVGKYAVVCFSDRAGTMIGILDKIIPVEAMVLNAADSAAVWASVGTQPKAGG